MAVLLEVSMGDEDGLLIVEVDRSDIPGDEMVLASPQPGEVAARAKRTFQESLDQLEPLLRTVKEKLVAAAPDTLEVEFGVKLGGETGIILAKGTAEVNLSITMTWTRTDDRREQSARL